MFRKKSCTCTISGLKEGNDEIKSKMYTKVTKLKFSRFMKTSKRGQCSRKPFPWKFCNTLFLGWTCFKKLCNFEALGFFRGWQNYPLLTSMWRNYTSLYVTIFVTFMPSICFCNNYDLLGATDLYEVSITSFGS